MAQQAAQDKKDIIRVKQFAEAAVIHFRRKHYDRTKGEFREPSSTQQTKEYEAFNKLISKMSIDRISKIEMPIRAMLFQDAARDSLLGRNNVKELARIMRDYRWEFKVIAEITWLEYYNKECMIINHDLNLYLSSRVQ